LAILLRQGGLKPVYQGELSTRALKEYVATYEALVADSVRVMNRIKGLFRSRAIRCSGTGIYQSSQRTKWLSTLNDEPLKDRAEAHYELLDWLKDRRKIARAKMLSEARKHKVNSLLQTIPGLGAISAAQIIATAAIPFRFRTKRQFWAYCGLAVVMRSTSDYELSSGRFVRKRRAASNRGLNRNYSRRLKNVFKAAAMQSIKREPFAAFYQTLIHRGMKPELARLTLARKIAAIVLAIWKRQDSFDKNRMLGEH
jgi:transposase